MDTMTATENERPMPTFDSDPIGWFAWADQRIASGDREAVVAAPPVSYGAPSGECWRMVQTEGGIEARPALVNEFLHTSRNPLITAILVDRRIVVELSSVEGRWIGEFDIDELDLAELGRAMIEQRHLPHDNLRFLFARSDRAPRAR